MSGIIYKELLANFRKGLRNGNWRKQNPLDKALYRASLWYVKHHGSIVNVALVEKLLALVDRLKETKGRRRGIYMGASIERLAERPLTISSGSGQCGSLKGNLNERIESKRTTHGQMPRKRRKMLGWRAKVRIQEGLERYVEWIDDRIESQ